MHAGAACLLVESGCSIFPCLFFPLYRTWVDLSFVLLLLCSFLIACGSFLRYFVSLHVFLHLSSLVSRAGHVVPCFCIFLVQG